MADYQSIVTGDTKEAVAYALLMGIAYNQDKVGYPLGSAVPKADEQWVLETYVKCLKAANGVLAR